ncbi:MAG: TonB-dependent receptor [Acidobacteria bacterium]|nr:TonB-dependent receptor [Acidobacteriota bacterium]
MFRFSCALLALAGIGAAQTASLSGTARDSSGGLVSGVSVKLKDTGRGSTRAATTDSSGAYQFALLPPGEYEIEAVMSGFQPVQQSGIVLLVDERQRLDFTLQVGAVSTSVEITGSATSVQTETGLAVGAVIENKRVLELPLNGRNFNDLSLMAAGTFVPNTASRLGQTFGLISGGLRDNAGNFLMDGINNNDVTQNQITFQPNVEVIQEFKIQNNTYSAEYGRNAGAVVNMVTRSGSNTFHGSLFEFLRNERFDARNFFNTIPRPQAPFKRNVFGFVLGGPLSVPKVYSGHDRTFYFVNYEARRQRENQTVTTRVLTDEERAGVTDPIARRFAELLPRPNIAGAATGSNYTASSALARDQDQFSVKIDHRFSDRDTIFGRYTFQDDRRLEPFSQGNLRTVPGFGDIVPAFRTNAVIGHTHLLSSRLINEFRAGLNRNSPNFLNVEFANPDSFGIPAGLNRPFGVPDIFLVSNNLRFGSPNFTPQGRRVTSFVYQDNLSWTSGKHQFKFGAEVRRNRFNSFNNNINLTLRFNTVADFQAGRLAQATQNTAERIVALRSSNVNFYAQDDWKLAPSLTLNLGVRYELNTIPYDNRNFLSVFDFAARTFSRTSQTGINGDYNNYGPRIGLSWDPFGKGKTAIRGGYGLYFDQFSFENISALSANPPLNFNKLASNTTLAAPLGTGTGTPNIVAIDPGYRTPYVQQFNFNVQHQVFKDTTVEAGWYGSKGTRLPHIRNINAFLGGVRPIARSADGIGLGQIPFRESASNSTFHSFQTTARSTYRNSNFYLAYTFSKAIDGISLDTLTQGLVGYQDVRNTRADKGLADFDARHRLVYSWIYELPFRAHGLAGKVIRGWQLSTTGSFQSGNPWQPVLGADNSGSGDFNDRPNLIGDPKGPQTLTQWANPAAFAAAPRGQFGNSGRNILTGPGYANLDLGFFKNTYFGHEDRFRTQLRAEFFNLPNHPNFAQPGRSFPSATFGSIATTRTPAGDAGSARQIQLGLKFYW